MRSRQILTRPLHLLCRAGPSHLCNKPERPFCTGEAPSKLAQCSCSRVSTTKRIVPEFQAGLGGVNLKFYTNQQYCDAFAGCSSSNSYLESSNHLQVHLSAGVRLYLKDSLYIHPQADLHWVNNFFQFGSSWVPEYGVAVGYTFGRH